NADRGYELPESIINSRIISKTIEVLDNSFSLYNEMISEIPMEDARYILPLYTRTNIQTSGNARELIHLQSIAEDEEIPSVSRNLIYKIIEKTKKVAPKLFKERKMNQEKLNWYPAAKIYGENRIIKKIVEDSGEPKEVKFVDMPIQKEDIMKVIREKNDSELSNLKHIHNYTNISGFLVPVSLVTLHQIIRQRTLDHAVESIYDAALRGDIIIPASIQNSKWNEKYLAQNREMLKIYMELQSVGINKSDAIGVIPQSILIYDLVHINGWNAINAIGKRMCSEAQWEIRHIAEKIAIEIGRRNRDLLEIIGPQCRFYGNCPERKPCNRFGKSVYEFCKNEDKKPFNILRIKIS
ncbi:MAG: FAD-dependent thymidylate synthase, partial [Candidatus Micrarchaeota archaeon]|nr:FAD-dependent thymidylate synthase [Candidatus Micrarchaeota archaeon]